MTTVSREQLVFCRRGIIFGLGTDHAFPHEKALPAIFYVILGFICIAHFTDRRQASPALHFPSSSAPSQRGRHYHNYLALLKAYFAAWKPTKRFHILVKLLFSVL